MRALWMLTIIALLGSFAVAVACGGGDDDDDATDDDAAGDDDDDDADDDAPPPTCAADQACVDSLIDCYGVAENTSQIIDCETALATCTGEAGGCFGDYFACESGCAGDPACIEECAGAADSCFDECHVSFSCWQSCQSDLEDCVVGCGPSNHPCTQACYIEAWDTCYGGCGTM